MCIGTRGFVKSAQISFSQSDLAELSDPIHQAVSVFPLIFIERLHLHFSAAAFLSDRKTGCDFILTHSGRAARW
jgi:hypothetical protein